LNIIFNMKKQILSEEFIRMQKLAGIITENEYKQKLIKELQYFHNGTEMNQIINYDNSDITDDLEALGQGSMDGQDFTPGRTYNIGGQEYKIEAQGDEFKLKTKDIDKIANSTGTLTVKSPGIGYNLVLPIEQAKKLPGAKETEVEKIEGPNKIKVPAITTSAPLTQFKSDGLTIIVRPKKDEAGTIIPNEYIVLSAFPGDPSIPRASEWGGKYAVIIPGGGGELNENEQMFEAKEDLIDKYKSKIETFRREFNEALKSENLKKLKGDEVKKLSQMVKNLTIALDDALSEGKKVEDTE